nr:PspC domain-containing protein [uncultured Actinoplanes sp.]
MNDEAADKRGPSGPSQDEPAPSAPAAKDTPPAAPTTDSAPEPPTAAAPADEPATAAFPAGEPATAAFPAGEPATAAPASGEHATSAFPADEPAAWPLRADEPPTEPIAPKPSAWMPPAGDAPEADVLPTAFDAGAGAPPPPPPGAGPTPPPPGAGPTPPPWAAGFGGANFNRDHLVRPKQGRYIAGVSGALARATNTDPVLWRVLLAVLGVMSGVGVLLYLIGWLVIPAEGEPASPIESLLGKGRSGMTPFTVVLLGGAAVLTFAFIVQDGVRAGLLAAAVILAAVLLIKRGQSNANAPAPEAATFPGAAPGTPPPAPADVETARFAATTPAAATATEPVTEPIAPRPPQTGAYPPETSAFAPPSSTYSPHTGAYRPPFAPHGPYASHVPPAPPAPPTPAPRREKPPKERSKLGRLTFFAVVVVIGLMAAIDMAGASIAISAYFAAALITIALGLVVGAWFGRARGLIALALLTTLGLFVSTGAERWGGEIGNSVYRPLTLAAVADRYDFAAGNATLDLRRVDFTGQTQNVTVTMKVGQLRVLLPENVDTKATVQVDNGRARVLGKHFDGREIAGEQVENVGPDGAGGGNLTLDLQLDTGNLEVLR